MLGGKENSWVPCPYHIINKLQVYCLGTLYKNGIPYIRCFYITNATYYDYNFPKAVEPSTKRYKSAT